jgi:hypothetical protein
MQLEKNPKGDILQMISHRIPVRLLNDVTKFQMKHEIEDRSKAINRLLEISIMVWEKGAMLKKNPEMLDELWHQVKEGAAVEYLTKLTPKELEVIYTLVDTEYKARFKKGLPPT